MIPHPTTANRKQSTAPDHPSLQTCDPAASRQRPSSALPPSCTEAGGTPGVIWVKRGRDALYQPECDLSKIKIWLRRARSCSRTPSPAARLPARPERDRTTETSAGRRLSRKRSAVGPRGQRVLPRDERGMASASGCQRGVQRGETADRRRHADTR